ncbi:hypothetical protein EJ08DRAFT_665033 [Tothia fuscella]|uniref:Vacuolar protein sorting protein 62 n=1 Tax=Tothia fuscella TaxID=1048955 RepID=A0A9P4NHK1_9PEZI|nr:hypothetical protein EJ08DRAFT_665033 [Tothia fuscella]
MGVCRPRNAVVSTLLSLATFGGLLHHFGTKPMTSESLEDVDWIGSSTSWLDRKACTVFGICGLSHMLHQTRWRNMPEDDFPLSSEEINSTEFWISGLSDPKTWTKEERTLRKVPKYVIDHAPYVHLFSKEEFWPCDMPSHLAHTTPHVNYTIVSPNWQHPKLTDLDLLNKKFGRHVFLKSNDNVEERPDWLGGSSNIPEAPNEKPEDGPQHFRGQRTPPSQVPEDSDLDQWWQVEDSDLSLPDSETMYESATELRRRQEPSAGGRSDAPAVLVVVDKGKGVVDAFWFYFYSYNLGNKVFNVRFGNHIGDWEHTLIRFHNGKPKAIFFSEHDLGAAYSWEAVEKIGKRPVSYSATGTHAMYADAGVHTYVLPFGLLHDITDRGPLWDPALNLYSYTYDYKNDTLRSSQLNPKAPTSWFYFWGHWGDKFYPLNDPRQYRFVGQYHYVNGPLGPRFKRLGRKKICQGADAQECKLRHWIGDGMIPQVSKSNESPEGEEIDLDDPDTRRLLKLAPFF